MTPTTNKKAAPGKGAAYQPRAHYTSDETIKQALSFILLRVSHLSGFVARNLSGCHIALGGRYEADTSATGDTEDEIRRSL
jgi:hypothetical protein